MIYFGESSMVAENVFSVAIQWSTLKMSVKYISFIMLLDISIDESGILRPYLLLYLDLSVLLSSGVFAL
jgi:hypothetical protein